MSENRNLPPHDLEIEMAFLNALLYEDRAWEILEIKIKPEEFYSAKNRIVYEAFLEVKKDNTEIDIVLIKNKLVEMNRLATIGGLPYLTEIMQAFSSNINIYAPKIRSYYKARCIIKSCTSAIETAYQNMNSERAETEINRCLESLAEKSGSLQYQKLDMLVNTWFKDLDVRQELSKITTGLHEVDLKLKLNPGLHILAARPAMGKTQLALQIAMHNAKEGRQPDGITIKPKQPVYIESLEMDFMPVTDRIVSTETGVKLYKIKKNKLNEDDYAKLGMLVKGFVDAELFINCPNELNINNLKANMRYMKRKHNIELGIVDYIGLMELESTETKTEAIGMLSRALKLLSKELQIPIIILSQLSRKVEERPNKRPMLSDIRDSGSLEQDADSVIFIYRDEYYGILKNKNNESTIGKAEIIIGKQRDGDTGAVVVKFDAPTVTFKNDF